MTTTTTISNLPAELVEKIISRIPLTSMRSVRLTCRNWDTLFKSRSFTELHIGKIAAAAAREGESPPVIVLMEHQLYLMSVTANSGIDADPSTQPKGKLIRNDSDQQVKIHQIYDCEGLLLCTLEDDKRIVVWNPYLGQTRWIKLRFYFEYPRDGTDRYRYALGYDETDKTCRSYKILRFMDVNLAHWDHYVPYEPKDDPLWYEIYDFDSGEWTTLDVGNPHWFINFDSFGVSLKGNTYWKASPRILDDGFVKYFICFDFTRNRFGPLLPLPLMALDHEPVTLSCVREEKLAVFYQKDVRALTTKVWITQTIEAKEVSWIQFLTLDMNPDLLGLNPCLSVGSFFIDEEKKVAVVFGKDKCTERHKVYVIGESGHFREVPLQEYTDRWSLMRACCYVPSLAQIKQPRGGQREQQISLAPVLERLKISRFLSFGQQMLMTKENGRALYLNIQ
ncbi:unnamed protein product [Microthlaspi erraticum]|uniref:F-box domain-containing protein n=1 Tax=Microthlaspi erraticum TaxID=1685480 RepID=A0A6D2HSZ0_9BRAS|nr:unnamed protein product [Microthlaspi erraticum]